MKNVIRKVAAPTLLALAVVTTSAWAQSTTPAAPDASAPAPHAMAHHAKHARHAAKRPDFVEQRLNTLHSQLQITAAQSSQWDAFAQAMRDSAQKAQAAYKDRASKLPTENADDAMKSYAALTQMHADNTQKLSAAFSPLYAALSDSQKKTADTLFRDHPGNHHGRRKNKMNSSKQGTAQDPSAKGMPAPAPAQ